MALHSANELRAVAELLDAIEKFQCDHSHDLTLIGSLDVSDGLDTQCKACRQAKAKTAEARNTPSTRANWARGTMAKLHLTERDYS